MNTPTAIDFDRLRQTRDFLTLLLTSTPDAATDLLTNHGEDVLASFQTALGAEAFLTGENVLASPEDAQTSEFMAIVKAVRPNTDGTPLFTVEDQEGECFDATAAELTIEPTCTTFGTAKLFAST